MKYDTSGNTKNTFTPKLVWPVQMGVFIILFKTVSPDDPIIANKKKDRHLQRGKVNAMRWLAPTDAGGPPWLSLLSGNQLTRNWDYEIWQWASQRMAINQLTPTSKQVTFNSRKFPDAASAMGFRNPKMLLQVLGPYKHSTKQTTVNNHLS